MKELVHSSASFDGGSRVCWEFGDEKPRLLLTITF